MATQKAGERVMRMRSTRVACMQMDDGPRTPLTHNYFDMMFTLLNHHHHLITHILCCICNSIRRFMRCVYAICRNPVPFQYTAKYYVYRNPMRTNVMWTRPMCTLCRISAEPRVAFFTGLCLCVCQLESRVCPFVVARICQTNQIYR